MSPELPIRGSGPLKRAQLAAAARGLIERRFASPAGCSTALISQLLGVSASLLCHCYRDLYGRTIGEDIRKRRVALACEILRQDPRRLIKEVAAESGYRHCSYRTFLNAFRAEVGMSPSRYQRQAATGSTCSPTAPGRRRTA